MANVQVKDGAGATKYLKASGAGSDGDPFIPQHSVSGSVTVADGGSTLSVDDGGGALTVDGAVTVSGTVTASGPVTDAELRASPVPVSGTVTVSSAPTTAITAAALPLPSGAATAANQATAIGHLATIAGVAGDALTDTELRASPVPVSAASLPLPTGAATAANQSTGIGHLATLAGAVAGTEFQVDVLTLPNVTIGAAIPAGTNNIGDVDIASIAAGDNNIGNVDLASAIPAGENLVGLVGASDIVVTVTPTCDTSAYASGDLIFDSTEVANAARVAAGCAVLQSVTIIDKDDQGAAFTLLIADTNTDFGTLNAAPDADDTEAATVIGWVPIATSDYVDLGGAKVACIRNIGLTLKAAAASTSLYVAAMNGTGTPTYTASGLVIKLGFLRS